MCFLDRLGEALLIKYLIMQSFNSHISRKRMLMIRSEMTLATFRMEEHQHIAFLRED